MPRAPHTTTSRSSGQTPVHDLLSDGDPRTLRNVDEVVETVLARPGRLDELIQGVLQREDDIARMRAGDALEKVCRARPSLLQPAVPLLLGELATVRQPSVRWHMAQMLGRGRLTQSGFRSLANRARKLQVEFGSGSAGSKTSRTQ